MNIQIESTALKSAMQGPIDFRSDNVATVAPEVMDAVLRANRGTAASYGQDEWSQILNRRFSELFEKDVWVVPVATGTAANAISVATLTPPYGAVFCHEDAHIETSELAATEFFSGGAKLLLQPGAHARFEAATLADALTRPFGRHKSKPSAVSITQATEYGTLYQPDHVRAIGDVARAHKLKFHMDGARFANALAALQCKPADITWRAGVDILSFGATKNGGMNADAIMLFNPALVDDLTYRLRRAGQTWSKMRFAAAQLDAYVEDGRFIRYARRANALAARLATGLAALPGVSLYAPTEANEVFAVMPDAAFNAATDAGVLFMTWAPNIARFVCRHDGSEAEVDALLDIIKRAV